MGCIGTVDVAIALFPNSVDLFPEWRGRRQEFDAAMAISQIFLEGMAISLCTGGMDQAMVEPMLQLVEQQISLRKPKPSG